MRETQVLQGTIDRIVRHRQRKLLIEPHDQIARPPANHAVDRRDRPLLHDPGEKSPVRIIELGRHARRRDIDETVRPLLVEPDHPIPQCLTIHPADLRRVFPRGPVKHSRDRQQPSRLRGILCAFRKQANLAGRIVRPHRNCLAHGKHPPFATLNHAARDLEIPHEFRRSAGWYNTYASLLHFRDAAGNFPKPLRSHVRRSRSGPIRMTPGLYGPLTRPVLQVADIGTVQQKNRHRGRTGSRRRWRMQQSLSALIVEDREPDAVLLDRELRRSGYQLSYERVDCKSAMTAALNRWAWDIVIADYSMPQFNARAALAVMAKLGLDTPLIVVSGSVGDETAVEVMRAGARDLVLKHNLKRLPPVVARELEAARMRREQRTADAKLDCERQLLQQLMQGIPDAICFKDLQRRYIRLNDAERSNLKIQDNTDVIGETSDRFISPELAQARRAEEERVLATGEPLVDCVDQIIAQDGTIRWLSATKAPIRGPDGEITGIVEIARDITESKRQEQLKNEFIATVSHELRTPLTSIMGSVGTLAAGAAGALPEISQTHARHCPGQLQTPREHCERYSGHREDRSRQDAVRAQARGGARACRPSDPGQPGNGGTARRSCASR